MSFPSDGDVIEVAVIAELDGSEDLVNVFQFKVSNTNWLDDADYFADLQQLVAALVVWLKASASLLATWKRFRARNLTNPGATVIAEMTTPVSGASSTDLLPLGVSGLLVFRTPEAGVVLRKFLGGQHELSVGSSGQWVSSTITSFGATVTGLLAPMLMSLSDWQYGHISKATGVWLEPTSGYVSAEPAYQRRRRRGVGS